MGANIYSLRQALLRELREQRGAPMRLCDVLAVTAEPALTYFPGAAGTEWLRLADFGYIEAVPGFGGEYHRTTERGLRQLEPEFPQDPFVWGPGAK